MHILIAHISNTKFKNLFSLKIVKHENIVLSESYQFLRLCGLRSPAANLTNGRLITIICCGGFRVYFHICPAKLFVLSAEMIQGPSSGDFLIGSAIFAVAFIKWFWVTGNSASIYFWICKKMRRKMTSQRNAHKCDKLTLINALHLSYKNILRNFVGNFFGQVS